MFAEVEELMKFHMEEMKAELQRRKQELEAQRKNRERLKSEKQEVEEREVFVAMEMMDQLKTTEDKPVEEKNDSSEYQRGESAMIHLRHRSL